MQASDVFLVQPDMTLDALPALHSLAGEQQTAGSLPMTGEFVIVGGGPVGMWLAIQLKKRKPLARVIVYERYEQYQRSHVLRLDHWSLLLYSKKTRDAAERAYLQALTGRSLSGLFQRADKSVYVRTNVLEEANKAYAAQLGVELCIERVSDLAGLRLRHLGCRAFIACDGAHSPLREELLGPDALDTTNLKNVLELKFEEHGGRGGGSSLGHTWEFNRQLQHAAMDHVGKTSNDGRRPVTLRLFLDEDEYASLPAMTFKEPFLWGQPGLPPSVEQDIACYLAHREAATGARLLPQSGRLSKLVLSMYAARHFVVHKSDFAWFLCGDAALAVPYFRALNSGLMLASRLAQILAKADLSTDAGLKRAVAKYEFHRPLHIQTEFAIARSKDLLLDGFFTVREWLAQPPVA